MLGIRMSEASPFLPDYELHLLLQRSIKGSTDRCLAGPQRGDEVRGKLIRGDLIEMERLTLCHVDSVGVVIPLLRQPLEDQASSVQSRLWITERVMQSRRLREAGEKAALPEGKVTEGFAEVEPCGFPATLTVISVVQSVQIGGEDLLLGPAILEVPGGKGFPDFVEKVTLSRRGGNFDQLLGYCGGARDDAPFQKKVSGSSCDREVVEAAVPEEPLVLGNQGSVNEGRRDLGEGNGLVVKIIRSRHFSEDESGAIRYDDGLGGLGPEPRGQLESEGQDAPSRHSENSKSKETPSLSGWQEPFDPSLEVRHHRVSVRLAVGSLERVGSDEPVTCGKGKELGLVHRLHLGRGSECGTGRRDPGLIGKSVASRAGDIVHKEENSIVSEFLMRDAPVLINLQPSRLTGKISIHCLKD